MYITPSKPYLLPAHSFLNEKVTFNTNLFSYGKVKIVSEEPVIIGPNTDVAKKVVAIKAPKIKILSLLSASEKLVLHTDVLIIDGGYITEPKYWDIQADKIRLVNASEQSQWIASLIEENAIHSSNFKSIEDPDCNFDIPAQATVVDRVIDIKNRVVDVKNRLKKMIGR